jgi:pimeloyl-ACP methyl ester carboxylesterase
MKLIERTFTRKDATIHYWMDEKAGAPLVVFTHGAAIDHHEWDATLPLVAENFGILTWDMRGHGLSRPGHFVLQDAVDDLLVLLDSLKVKQAIFVGHSMGGNLHQELVFQHPERVKAMVFLDCTWNFQKLNPLDTFTLRFAKPLLNMYSQKSLIDQSLKATSLNQAGRDLLRPAMELTGKEEFINILLAATACLHYEPGYAISKPLLLILGEKDRTGNIARVMPLWAKQEPNCRFVVVPNASHAVNLDQPEVFHNELLDFLKKQFR